MLIRFSTRGFLSDDGGAEGGDRKERPSPSALAAQYHNDAIRISEKLAEVLEDNYKLRDKNRTLTTDLASARGKAAPEGSRILKIDEATAYDAYVALGPVADVQTALTERDTLKDEVAKSRRDDAIRGAAEAHGYKAGALGRLPSLAGKELLLREVEVDGQRTRRAFVKDASGETALPDFLTQHEADLLPALTVEAASSTQQQQRGGTPYPAQQANTQQRQTGDKAAQHIAQQEERRKAQPNPLMPKQ